MTDDSNGEGGLIDVHGLSFHQFADALDGTALHRVLDHILTVSDNSVGFNGFNNSMPG
jgi:hypothetical protein